jgi:ABC-2 type transport system permease protein
VTAVAGTGALARLAARRDRILLPAWLYALTAVMAGTGYSFRSLYATQQSRDQVFAGTAHNPSVLAVTGPLFGTSTGALTAWKYGAIAAALAALMSIEAVTRHTRADEEAGRLELICSAGSGRQAPLAAALLVAAGANATLAVLLTAALTAVGLPPSGALALGLAVAGCGLVFAGVAAVAAQLAASGRASRGLATGVLGAAYLIHGAASAAAGAQWLGWLSPVYWAVQVRPFAGDRWPLLLLPAAAAVVFTALAVTLAIRRDLGAGLVPSRPGPARAGAALRSPLTLAWRLQRGSVAGWSGAMLLAGFVSGSVAHGIGPLLGSGAQVRTALVRIGGHAGLSDAYLAATIGVFGLVAAAYAVAAVLRLRSDEVAGRADPVLATSAGRISWAAGHLLIVMAGTGCSLAAAGLGEGVGYGARGGDLGTQVPRLLGAALAQLPAALAVAGIAVALFGLLPAASVPGGWSALAVAAGLALLGPTLRLSGWVQDISPFTHVARLPGGSASGASLAWLAGTAAALALAGLAGLRRRDID